MTANRNSPSDPAMRTRLQGCLPGNTSVDTGKFVPSLTSASSFVRWYRPVQTNFWGISGAGTGGAAVDFLRGVLGQRCSGETMGKHNSKLTKEELEDLEEATNFNTKQLRKWYKDFIQDCPSGYMTKEEFKHIYGQFFPSGDPTRFVDYVFNVFDIDKNGVITFKEFILAISITTRGTVEEKLNWAFSLYDFDSDGYVSREEMLDIVRAIHRMHGREGANYDSNNAAQQRVDQLFTKLDTDRDGKLSREEFCKGFRNDAWIIKALLVRSPLAAASVANLGSPQEDGAKRSNACSASVGNGLH